MKQFEIIDGKSVDIRNDIVKRVQGLIKHQTKKHFSVPTFLEWSWGTMSSRTRNTGEVEYCELVFKQKSVSSEIKDYIYNDIVEDYIHFGEDIIFTRGLGQCLWRYKYESEMN